MSKAVAPGSGLVEMRALKEMSRQWTESTTQEGGLSTMLTNLDKGTPG